MQQSFVVVNCSYGQACIPRTTPPESTANEEVRHKWLRSEQQHPDAVAAVKACGDDYNRLLRLFR